MSESGGTLSTSMNMSICSCQFSPGKSGQPRQSQARMQPMDHISIAGEYVTPKIIQGARQNLLWMQVQICSGWKHPEPKSIILMPVFPYCLSRMFSGFRSQWMISCLLRKSSPCRTCMATRRIMSMVKPLNFSSRLSQYKFIWSNSKTRQACPRKKKPCLSWTILLFPFGSIMATVSRMRISTLACRLNFAQFLIIFKATSQRFLWSNDLKTCPKDPYPSRESTSYRQAMASPGAIRAQQLLLVKSLREWMRRPPMKCTSYLATSSRQNLVRKGYFSGGSSDSPYRTAIVRLRYALANERFPGLNCMTMLVLFLCGCVVI